MCKMDYLLYCLSYLTIKEPHTETKGDLFRLGDEVTTVIIQIVLLKCDVTTSVAEHGVYVPII